MAKNKFEYEIVVDVNKESMQAVKQTLTNLLESVEGKNIPKAQKAVEDLNKILNKSYGADSKLKLKEFNDGIIKQYGSVENLKKELEQFGAAGIKTFNNLANSVSSADIPIKKTSKLLDNLADTFSKTVKYGIASSVFNRITGLMSTAYNYSIDLDKSLNDIRIVTNKSADEMERFAVSANKAAKSLGASTKDYTKASLIYYQQGLSDEEVNARTNVTLKAANVTGQQASDVSEQLTAVWNGYKVSAQETEKYIDKLAAVAATTASDLEELSVGMSKVASAANNAGVDIDQMNAMLSTVISVTREAPETIGTSFRTLFARIGDLKLGATDEDGVNLGKVSSQLKSIGVQVLDQQGNMRNMGQILEDLAAKWKTLTDAQQQATAVSIGGKMQYSRLIALMDNWDKYTEALETSKNATGTLQHQQDIYMESTEAHLQKLKTEAERTYNILFDEKAVNSFTNALSTLLKVVNNLGSGFGDTLGVFTRFATLLGSTKAFSGRFAESIERNIENFEISQQHKSEQQIKEEWKQKISLENPELDPNSARLEAEAEFAAKFTPVWKNLTEEQRKQINLARQQIGLDTEKLKNGELWYQQLENISDETKEILNKNENLQKAFSKDNIKNIEPANVANALKEIEPEIEKYTNLTENQAKIEEKIISLYDKRKTKGAQKKWSLKDDLKEFEQINFAAGGYSEEEIQAMRNYFQGPMGNAENFAKKFLDAKNRETDGMRQKFEEDKELFEKSLKDRQEYVQKKEELEKRIGTNTQKGDEINQQGLRQQNIQNTIQLVSNLTTVFVSLRGVIKTINDESLSFEEKLDRIFPVILSSIPAVISLIKNWQTNLISLIGLMNADAAAKLKAALATHNYSAAMSIATGATATFMTTILPVIAVLIAITAAIAATVAVVYALTKAWNADADAAKEAKKNLQQATEAYINAKKAADELRQSLTKYDEALKNIEELTVGTQKYADAVKEANEETKALIKQLKIKDNQILYKNGLITIDREALKEAQIEANNAVFNTEKQKYNAEIASGWATLRSETTNLSREVGINLSRNWKNYIDDVILSIHPLTRQIASTGLINDVEYLSNKETTDIVSRLREIKDAEDGRYETIMAENAAFEDWLKTTYSGNVEMESLISNIKDQRSGFEALVTSTNEVIEAQKEYVKQINISDVEALYRDTLEKIATNPKTGQVDELLYNELLQVIKKSNLENQVVDIKGQYRDSNSWKEIVSKNDPLGYWYERVLPLVVRDNIQAIAHDKAFSPHQYDWSSIDYWADESEWFLNDKNKQVINKLKALGMTDVDLQKKIGRTAIETDEDLFNVYAKLTNQKYEDVVSDEDDVQGQYRKYIFELIGTDFLDATVDKAMTGARDGMISALGKMRSKALEYGEEELGADLSSSVMDYIINGNNEFDLSAIANRISPTEIEGILAKDPKELAELLGFTDDIIQGFSLEEMEKIGKSFQDAAKKVDWSISGAVESSLAKKESELPDDLSKKKLEQYKESVKNFAENLMEVARAGGEVSDSLKEDSDMATTFGLKVAQMNKAINTLADNFANWKEILQTSEPISEEYATAMVNMRNALADVYDVSSELISGSFIKEHFKEIGQIAEGDEKAIESLREELNQNIVENIIIKNKYKIEDDVDQSQLVNNFINLRDTLQNALNAKPLLLGDNIELSQDFVKQMNDFIDKSALTVEDANSIFSSLGIEPVYETDTVDQEQWIPKTTTTHYVSGVDFQNLDFNLFGNKINIPLPTWSTAEEVNTEMVKATQSTPIIALATNGKQPHIKGFKKSVSGSMNNYSSTNKGGGSPGSSKGGSKKKKGSKPYEKEADIYHEVNAQIKKVDNSLQRLQKIQKKALGTALLENLNEQFDLLNQQIDNHNRKLAIAKGEYQDLRNKLEAVGATFGEDGLVTNYEEFIKAKEKEYNDLLKTYDTLSDTQKEQWDSDNILDNKKTEIEKYYKWLDEADKILTETIPQEIQNVRDNIAEQIAINIQKFNMEIDLRLDTQDAIKDWHSFKNEILDDWNNIWNMDTFEENFEKTAKQNFDLIQTYLKDGEFGSALGQNIIETTFGNIDTSTLQGSNIANYMSDYLGKALEEAQKLMQKGETTGIFGDDTVKAVENLETYKDKAEEIVKDVTNAVKTLREQYLKTLQKVTETFDDQIKLYDRMNNYNDHNVKLIKLLYGDKQFDAFGKYYQDQFNNHIEQLKYLKEEEAYWKKVMDSSQEGSEEWKYAKEQWLSTVEAIDTKIEQSAEKAKEEWENAIDGIFDKLDKTFTDGLGFDYIKEEWTLINKNADEYLDAINSSYGIQKIENKYKDAIDKTDNVGYQRRLNKLMEEEVGYLQSIDKLTQTDIDRAELKYQIALKQIALEEAQQNKTSMRLRRDSQGNYSYQFVANDDEIDKAREELEDLKNKLYNFDLSAFKENLNKAADAYEEYMKEMAETAKIVDEDERIAKIKLIQEQYLEYVDGLGVQNERLRTNLIESAKMEAEAEQKLNQETKDAFLKATDEEIDKIMNELVPQWNSGIDQMIQKFSGDGEDSFKSRTEKALENLEEANETYKSNLKTIETTSGEVFGKLTIDVDKFREDSLKPLVDLNKDLLTSYQDQASEIRNNLLEANRLAQDSFGDLAKKIEEAYNKLIAYKRELATMVSNPTIETPGQIDNNSIIEKKNYTLDNGMGSNNSGSSGSGSSKSGINLNNNINDNNDSNAALKSIGHTGNQIYHTSEEAYGPYQLVKAPKVYYSGDNMDAMYWNQNIAGTKMKKTDILLALTALKKKVPGLEWDEFASGGYTGEWGSSGKFAMLHQKELILNAEDTSNFLNALGIMRSIVSNIGSSAFARLASLNANQVYNGSEMAPIEQNVTINADFPNATDHNEIQEAFNNLMNIATQRLHRNRM